MRLIAGIALITHGVMTVRSGPAIPAGLSIVAGLLTMVGLWMPITGWGVAMLGIWNTISAPEDPWAHIFLATFGAALALLGPGAYSVDARLYGWKRIDLGDRPK
jgi:putative oxidoreductase